MQAGMRRNASTSAEMKMEQVEKELNKRHGPGIGCVLLVDHVATEFDVKVTKRIGKEVVFEKRERLEDFPTEELTTQLMLLS